MNVSMTVCMLYDCLYVCMTVSMYVSMTVSMTVIMTVIRKKILTTCDLLNQEIFFFLPVVLSYSKLLLFPLLVPYWYRFSENELLVLVLKN